MEENYKIEIALKLLAELEDKIKDTILILKETKKL